MPIKQPSVMKRILLTVGSMFLMYQSLRFLLIISSLAGVMMSPIVALILTFIINLFVLGIFALLGFAWPTQKLLPSNYYTVKNPKLLKRISGILGLDFFHKVMMATVWRSKSMRKGFFNGRRDDLVDMEVKTRKSEFGHLIPFILIMILVVLFIFEHQFLFASMIMFFNVILNLYPILLQRNHRAKLQRIAVIQESKSNRT